MDLLLNHLFTVYHLVMISDTICDSSVQSHRALFFVRYCEIEQLGYIWVNPSVLIFIETTIIAF